MYLDTLPPDAAIGHILRHNLFDANGHKALAKGRRIADDDLPRLHALGVAAVRVAVLEPGDVHEDEAARRLSAAVCGPGVAATRPAASRVNLLATADGVARIDVGALSQINQIDGLTVATALNHALVRARKRVATIKIIPFALPEAALLRAETIGRAGDVVSVRPLRPHAVGVILVGSAAARRRIERGVYPAIAARIAELGSMVLSAHYVAPDEPAIAGAIADLQHAGAQILIIAGETSIMDRDDVTPQGIRLAGGRIEHFGAPVDPGNLLLLGYLDHAQGGSLPVLGAPGCVRSRDTNIVDLILPRLLAGEALTSRDIIALGHGGLLG